MEKFLFMLSAIQNEWMKFANSSDYDELPDDELSIMNGDEKKKDSTKQPYRPTGMKNFEAAEKYKAGDQLLSDDYGTGSLLDVTAAAE